MPCAFSRNPESTERVISVEPFTPASAIVECVRSRRSAAAAVALGFIGGAIMNSISGDDSSNDWNTGTDQSSTTYTETFVTDTYSVDTMGVTNTTDGTGQFTEYDNSTYQVTATVTY